MDTSRGQIFLLSGLLLFCGCGKAAQQQLVERELRQQEDRIYQLQDYIHQYQAMLESCRRENLSLKRELGIEDETVEPPSELPFRRSRRPGVELAPPAVEPGEPLDPDAMPELGPQIEDEPGELVTPDETLGERSSGPAEKLVINKLLTGGWSSDPHPGDEGILVVVEPRAADGTLVQAPGELSIMLSDPQQPGPAGRVARWDFNSAETAQAFQKTLLGRGLHFELPWPNQPPETGRLRLDVRVVTPEGKKLFTEADIEVDRDSAPAEPPLPRRSASAAAGWSHRTHPLPASDPPQVARTPERPATPQRPLWKPYR